MGRRGTLVFVVLTLAGAACAESGDVGVLGATLSQFPHFASITVDGASDEFGVECTLSDDSVRAVASSSEAVFSFDGKRDGSQISMSGFSSNLPEGFSASHTTATEVEVDLTGDILTGRLFGVADANDGQVSFRIDCS
ncbi:MAG: hypothetical protein HKN07_02250 [Acidimicrobiia bacterium]|nr:hypothetical protein [Acidimicrobiia bacterium]